MQPTWPDLLLRFLCLLFLAKCRLHNVVCTHGICLAFSAHLARQKIFQVQ